MNLGISLYPDQSDLRSDEAYIHTASKLGFTCVFMSFLQIDIQNPAKSIQRIKESIACAHKAGMEVILDIHPMVFTYLHCKEDDLSYFHELGVDVLRLDTGYDGRTEAMMTQNPYGISIELNVSRSTHELERVLDYHPNIQKLRGSHNFYPQRYTALDTAYFKQCTAYFKQYQIPTAAFVTSQTATISPWPISEGLCTIEEHRDLPLTTQVRHLHMMKQIDTVLIGNAYASEEELLSVSKIKEETVDTLSIELYTPTQLERRILLDHIQEYRGDASSFVIRSSKHRATYHQEPMPAHTTENIHRGDILILNEQYGQYKGELQIALKDRPFDPRINVVGRICEDEQILLEELKPFQTFRLQERNPKV